MQPVRSKFQVLTRLVGGGFMVLIYLILLKTELIWFGSRTNIRKSRLADLSLHVGAETINPVSSVRDLGVVLDDELTTKPHINIAFYHIRWLKKVRSILGAEITASLVSAFILNRPDYCNTVLANLSVSTVAQLQRVQNAVARLIKGLQPTWRQLFETYIGCRSGIVSHVNVCTDAPGAHRQQSIVSLRSRDGHTNIQFRKQLRSADTNRYELLTTRLKFGKRCFSHAGPKAWNALPAELQDLTDHNALKRQLKTFLFERMFTTWVFLAAGHIKCVSTGLHWWNSSLIYIGIINWHRQNVWLERLVLRGGSKGRGDWGLGVPRRICPHCSSPPTNFFV